LEKKRFLNLPDSSHSQTTSSQNLKILVLPFAEAMDTRSDGCKTPELPSPEVGRLDLYYRQLQKTMLDYLRTSGPPKDSPIMLRIEKLNSDSPSDG